MKLSLVIDTSGKVIAAVKIPDEPSREGIGVGIRPAFQDHQLHEITIPSRLEASTIREIVRELRTYSDGREPEIPG